MTFKATRTRAVLAVCALGLMGMWSAAHAADPSAQEIKDRLLGKDKPAADAPAAANPTAPGGAQPDCSTQEALESNPACFNRVSGSERGFSLIGPAGSASGSPSHGAVRAPPRATSGSAAAASGARPASAPVRHAAATGGAGAAAGSCGLRDSASDRGVNLCVTFALNSAVLTPKSRDSLGKLVQALTSPEIRGHTVRIEGYADASGNADANQALSMARAASVADFLVQHGVAREHVEAQGLGATHLLPDRAPSDPANRRVEARLKD